MPQNKGPSFHVILVEPKYPGNVGAVARCMKNFSISSLILINACPIDDECRTRAVHAQDVLDNAVHYTTFEEVIPRMDHLVATSSIDFKKDKKHLRNALQLEEFSQSIYETEGNIGLVFGREDIGLYNDEIAACDIMIKIPTSEEYPVMNLSHAVSCVLYSLYSHKTEPAERRIINDNEKELLHSAFQQVLDDINYPEHKKENTAIMFRRILGRALPSTWEYHTLMGVFTTTHKRLRKKKQEEESD